MNLMERLHGIFSVDGPTDHGLNKDIGYALDKSCLHNRLLQVLMECFSIIQLHNFISFDEILNNIWDCKFRLNDHVRFYLENVRVRDSGVFTEGNFSTI